MYECVTRPHVLNTGAQAAEYAWGAKLEEVSGEDEAPGDDGETSDDGVDVPTGEAVAEGGDSKPQSKTPKLRIGDADDVSDHASDAEDEAGEGETKVKMPFGKHRGEDLEDIPTDYLEFCLRERDLRPELAEEMDNQIRMRAGEGVSRGKKP